MNIKEKIGKRIKELRKEKKISQEYFASIANIERSFITHIESGRRNVSVNTLEKVTDALEISFFEFFNHPTFKSK